MRVLHVVQAPHPAGPSVRQAAELFAQRPGPSATGAPPGPALTVMNPLPVVASGTSNATHAPGSSAAVRAKVQLSRAPVITAQPLGGLGPAVRWRTMSAPAGTAAVPRLQTETIAETPPPGPHGAFTVRSGPPAAGSW